MLLPLMLIQLYSSLQVLDPREFAENTPLASLMLYTVAGTDQTEPLHKQAIISALQLAAFHCHACPPVAQMDIGVS